MTVDFYLPLEIIVNILSILPIKTILSCKCVCKLWLDLIESPEFSELFRLKSIVSLAVYHGGAGSLKPHKIFEVVHRPRPQNHWSYYNLLFGFEFPYRAYVCTSVNGLLLMCERDSGKLLNLYICNPITREYFKLPPSPPLENQTLDEQTFGFGVSKRTSQYKLVKVYMFRSEYYSECKIYTLGTRSWRSTKPDNQLKYKRDVGAFLNGNLHWLAYDSNGHPLVSCFDLETEIFSTFSSPPDRQPNPEFCCVSALGDSLCVCDNLHSELVVWMMKDYGDEKSWTKEYSIEKNIPMMGLCFPVEVSEDGDIWILNEAILVLVCYSNKAKAIQRLVPLQRDYHSRTCTGTAFYTPSFLSLKMFAMENVSSF